MDILKRSRSEIVRFQTIVDALQEINDAEFKCVCITFINTLVNKADLEDRINVRYYF